MKREPPRFTRDDFARAFFGSFIAAVTFLFKGSMVSFSIQMSVFSTMAVALLTCLLLTVEIYVLGYKYVQDRKRRPFLEFWAKRFFSIILSSFLAIYLLMFAYGIQDIVGDPTLLFKVAIAVLLPAATAGGAVEILRKKKINF